MSSSPHDTLVKQIFSNKEDSISFLESTLPREVLEILDLTNLEETKESFVNQNENTNHTDILWKIPLKSGESVYVYLLLEHKSYYDPNIYLQILGYLTNIYTWQKENQKALTPVIPFVFYHGEKKWDLGQEFLSQFLDKDSIRLLLPYIPNFKIELFDLEKTDIQKVFYSLTLNIYLSLIQKIRSDLEEFRSIFRSLLKALSRIQPYAKRLEILQKVLYYLFSAREKDAKEFRDEKYYRFDGLGEEYMTVLDEIKLEGKIEGKIEGIQEGERRGKLEGKLEAAEKMLAKGMSISDALEVTGLTESDLREKGII